MDSLSHDEIIFYRILYNNLLTFSLGLHIFNYVLRNPYHKFPLSTSSHQSPPKSEEWLSFSNRLFKDKWLCAPPFKLLAVFHDFYLYPQEKNNIPHAVSDGNFSDYIQDYLEKPGKKECSMWCMGGYPWRANHGFLSISQLSILPLNSLVSWDFWKEQQNTRLNGKESSTDTACLLICETEIKEGSQTLHFPESRATA